jgi:hypothetical protein
VRFSQADGLNSKKQQNREMVRLPVSVFPCKPCGSLPSFCPRVDLLGNGQALWGPEDFFASVFAFCFCVLVSCSFLVTGNRHSTHQTSPDRRVLTAATTHKPPHALAQRHAPGRRGSSELDAGTNTPDAPVPRKRINRTFRAVQYSTPVFSTSQREPPNSLARSYGQLSGFNLLGHGLEGFSQE